MLQQSIILGHGDEPSEGSYNEVYNTTGTRCTRSIVARGRRSNNSARAVITLINQETRGFVKVRSCDAQHVSLVSTAAAAAAAVLLYAAAATSAVVISVRPPRLRFPGVESCFNMLQMFRPWVFGQQGQQKSRVQNWTENR